MANNNMAFMLLAGGVAVIGAAVLLRPQGDEDEDEDDSDRRIGIGTGAGTGAGTGTRETQPNPQAPLTFELGGNGPATGWDKDQEGLEGEVILRLPPADIMADRLPSLAHFNAVVALYR